MGYMTDFEGNAGPFDNEDAAEFFEFKLSKKIGGYHIESSVSASAHDGHSVHFSLTDVKWYDYAEDLSLLSKAFPDITIDLEGNGEENGDQWKARFRNGESEQVDAIITFRTLKN